MFANAARSGAETLSSTSAEFVNRLATEGARAAQNVCPIANEAAQMASQIMGQAAADWMERQQGVRADGDQGAGYVISIISY